MSAKQPRDNALDALGVGARGFLMIPGGPLLVRVQKRRSLRPLPCPTVRGVGNFGLSE